MALKDWRLSRNDKNIIVYKHKTDRHKILSIHRMPTNKVLWLVSPTIYSIDDKYFKTKLQALKFARAYMKTH